MGFKSNRKSIERIREILRKEKTRGKAKKEIKNVKMKKISFGILIILILISGIYMFITLRKIESKNWITYRGNFTRSGESILRLRPPLKKFLEYEVDGFIISEPLLIDNIVVFCAKGKITAFDYINKKKKWEYYGIGYDKNKKYILDELKLNGTGLGGSILRSLLGLSAEIITYPSYSQSKIFFLYDDKLTCIDFDSGKHLWDFKIKTSPFEFSSPLLLDGIVYFGTENNMFCALNINNGKILWQFKTDDKIVWSPSLHRNNKILFVTESGNLYAVEKESKQLLWLFRIGSFPMSPPVVINDRVIITSKKKLYVLDIKKGTKLWEFSTKKDNFFNVSASKNKVFLKVANEDKIKSIYVFNLESGQLIKKFKYELSFFSDICISDNIMYLGTIKGRLIAIDINTLRPIWSFNIGEEITTGPIIGGKKILCIATTHKLHFFKGEK